MTLAFLQSIGPVEYLIFGPLALFFAMKILKKLRQSGHSKRILRQKPNTNFDASDQQTDHTDFYTHTDDSKSNQNQTRVDSDQPEYFDSQNNDVLFRNNISNCLDILGVSTADFKWEEVETRYRDLVKQYHPDKYASLDLPPEMTHAAEEKFKSVQNAFEYLKTHRRERNI
jgi:DnaJ-like protein